MTWYYGQSLIGYNPFLLFNKVKLLNMHFSPKLLQFVEKPPNESDQYHDQNN